MSKVRIQGIVVPMITPLTAEGEIDEAGVARLVEFLTGNGVHALFPLGSSGEFLSLTARQKETMIAATVRAAAGRVPVCAGISGNCLAEIHREAERAAALGAAAVAALTPYYFRASQSEMLRFFTAIAERSPVPLIPYNMPFRTNNNLEPDTVERLAGQENIIGIKDTVADMARTLDILNRVAAREDFSYLHGNELLTAPSLLFGGRGAVPSIANFAPRVMVETYDAARAGDIDRLKGLQARIQGLMRVWGLLESKPQESTTLRLQAIKAVLEIAGICSSRMAQLDVRPGPQQLERVRAFLRAERLFEYAGEPAS